MNLLERTLLHYLWDGQLEMKITGFDQAALEKTLRDTWKLRLDTIESIIYEDSDLLSDAEKAAAIRNLFEQEFYDVLG